MSVSRLSQTSVQNALQKFNNVWDGRSAIGAMDPIWSIKLTSAQSSVSFNNIPQTYTHLQLRAIAKDSQSTGNHSFSLTFNADSANNYTYHSISGNSSAVSSSATISLSSSYSGFITAADSTNIFGPNIIDIIDYTNTTKNKVTRTICGGELGTTGQVQMVSTLWLSTAAINSIAIFPAAGQTFSTYSHFALYGIR
jgi:hypothetical protein